MKKNDNKTILAPCCVIVDGQNFSCIYDLQRNGLYRFHKHYRNYFSQDKKNGKWIVATDLLEKNDKEFLETLLSNQLCIDSTIADSFMAIEEKAYVRTICENAIIDRDENSSYSMSVVANQLSSVCCEAICIRYFCRVGLKAIEKDLNAFNDSTIRHIEVHCTISEKITDKDYYKLKKNYGRLCSIYFYSESVKETLNLSDNFIVIKNTYRINRKKMCGAIYRHKMFAQTRFYLESKEFNNCLYRKIYISPTGTIKNCPEMPIEFGHIEATSFNIKLLFESKEFARCWYITKDKIESCKDCEFRYACIDCRCFTKEPNNPYSKPIKCNYNPYKDEK